MAKPTKTVKVRVSIPDNDWAILVEATGETDPDKVADVALREWLRWRKGENRHA